MYLAFEGKIARFEGIRSDWIMKSCCMEFKDYCVIPPCRAKLKIFHIECRVTDTYSQ